MSVRMKIGMIGVGVMGRGMLNNLVNAGYQIVTYTRTKEKIQDLLSERVEWRETPAAVAEASDIVLSMVGYPKDVEAVYEGENGLLSGAKPGLIAVDMTTSTPTLAKRLYEKAKDVNVHLLDAPVSGGDIGARNGTLSIMVGGDERIFRTLLPVFQVIGENIVYQGEAGAGQHTKMANQIAIASNMIGVMEAIAYAQNAGLDPDKVLQSISTGAAGSWSLSNLVPRVLNDDFAPGFFIKHFIKDMSIAIEEAEKMDLDLPGLELAKSMYERLAEKGYALSGTQALMKHYTSER